MSSSSRLTRPLPHNVSRLSFITPVRQSSHCLRLPVATTSRCFATIDSGPKVLPDVWFTGSAPELSIPNSNGDGKKPPNERTVKLGKTLRILQERLPTLLQSPLPQEIISPQITLHLFPSTHPHLPAVSGRVAYSAALWTSPIAWGRVPLVGNVKLQIISERMVKLQASYNTSSHTGNRPEQLIVRWCTIGKTKHKGIGGFYKGIGASENVDKVTEWLGGGKGEDDSKEFTGLFIFEFDEEGRIVSHTIEHVQQDRNWEKGVGARVVGLTDWLLGSLRNRGDTGTPCPAFTGETRNDKRQ